MASNRRLSIQLRSRSRWSNHGGAARPVAKASWIQRGVSIETMTERPVPDPTQAEVFFACSTVIAVAPKRARAGARTEAVPGGYRRPRKRALERLGESRAIVLVEGLRDRSRVETLAQRRVVGGISTPRAYSVVPIGGRGDRALPGCGSVPRDWTRDWTVSVTRRGGRVPAQSRADRSTPSSRVWAA